MASCLNGQWGRHERLSMFWNLLPTWKRGLRLMWYKVTIAFGATINWPLMRQQTTTLNTTCYPAWGRLMWQRGGKVVKYVFVKGIEAEKRKKSTCVHGCLSCSPWQAVFTRTQEQNNKSVLCLLLMAWHMPPFWSGMSLIHFNWDLGNFCGIFGGCCPVNSRQIATLHIFNCP